ncbi:hypothetical protein AMJ47_03815 [Parcubacteria bacterium DG_72]|nr:MAG: hypothetical protein AMJ47_03815 [Parcubacteria bacterium DG_72]
MLIFLYGQDTYRSREKLNEIVEHYKKTHQSGLNLRYFDAKNLSFQELKDELQIVPMFQEKKLFVLADIASNQEFKESFMKNSKKILDSDNVILFYEGGEVKKDSFFNLLKKQAKTQAFEVLAGQKLKKWLAKECEKHQASIDPQALNRLIEYVGNDLWQLSNEVQKLAAFKKGKEITVKDVMLLVKPKIETDIFKTIDAIALKNKKQALNLLHKHLEKGDNPLYLFSMINFQFRNILCIKDLMEKGKPLARSGLHPFVVRKSYQQAQRFSFDELKKIYQKIFQVDYNIKTGKVEAQTALDLLIAEL